MRSRRGLGIEKLVVLGIAAVLRPATAAANPLDWLGELLPGETEITPPERLLPGGSRFTIGLKTGGEADVEVTGENGELRTVKIETTTAALATLGRTSAEVEGTAGVELSYELTLPAEQLDAILRGDQPLPHPRDPSTFRPGMSILLDQTNVVGLGIGGAWRGLTASITETEGSGTSLAVTVLPDRTVEVTAGPTSLVRHEVFVGLGTLDARAGIKAGSTTTSGRLARVRMPVSTVDARIAFDRFVRDGVVPPGRHETVDFIRSESDIGAHAELAGMAWTFDLRGRTGEFRVTTHADGRRTVEAVYEVDGVTAVVTRSFDRNGVEDPSALTATLQIPTDEHVVGALEAVFRGTDTLAARFATADAATITLRGNEWREFTRRVGERGQLDALGDAPSPELLLVALAEIGPALPFFLSSTAIIDQRTIRPLPGSVRYHGVDAGGDVTGAGANAERHATTAGGTPAAATASRGRGRGLDAGTHR